MRSVRRYNLYNLAIKLLAPRRETVSFRLIRISLFVVLVPCGKSFGSFGVNLTNSLPNKFCWVLSYFRLRYTNQQVSVSEPSGSKINDFNLISMGRRCAVWLVVQWKSPGEWIWRQKGRPASPGIPFLDLMVSFSDSEGAGGGINRFTHWPLVLCHLLQPVTPSLCLHLPEFSSTPDALSSLTTWRLCLSQGCKYKGTHT